MDINENIELVKSDGKVLSYDSIFPTPEEIINELRRIEDRDCK